MRQRVRTCYLCGVRTRDYVTGDRWTCHWFWAWRTKRLHLCTDCLLQPGLHERISWRLDR